MTAFDIETVVAGLTLPEKAALVSGAAFWHTTAVERLGVPAIMVTDGPHGLRKQPDTGDHLGLGNSVPATCFPPAVTLGSSWDPELVRRVGEALGREARAERVSVLLGPGINIKRDPRCGRNFEYVSEDPRLAGRIGAALVAGIQSQGVGASVKHFAVNNQEADRMRVSADVDERTLREIYFPAFEEVVTTAQPWTVMCSYNRVNGVFASQNRWLLTEVLREQWGFEGLVVSDWGAVSDRAAAVAAGLDLAMPGKIDRFDDEVVAAVGSGALDEAVLDEAVRRVLRLVQRSQPSLADPRGYDAAAHHALAREAAAAGSVLLVNDPVDGTPLLPLDPAADLAVIGELARTPRYQGAGSSQVVPTRLDDPLSAIRALTGRDVPFAAGYSVPDVIGHPMQTQPAVDSVEADAALRAEAVRVARAAGTVVLVLGLPGPDESEGFDRSHLRLPATQLALLDAVVAANPRVVVVLANGGVVDLGWRHRVPALLEVWLGGQAGGSAMAEVLLGVRGPGGRLAETVPLRLEDGPAYGNFPGEHGHVRYGEGVLVGYRWYDTRAVDVAFPFGHGLSYTTVEYTGVTAEVTGAGAGAAVRVRVTVTNTGERPGREVVQVYVADPQAAVARPVHELGGFAAVDLAAGESREVEVVLPARALSYWHPRLRRFVVEGGTFVVEVGASSRDIRGQAEVEVAGEELVLPVDTDSTVGEWLAHPRTGPALRALLDATDVDPGLAVMLADMPARVAADFGFAGFGHDTLAGILREADAPVAAG